MKRERKAEDLAFGQRLQRFRKAAGLSRKQLAALIHVSPDTLATYENGWRGPSRAVLQRLADVFGVSTDALLGLEPEETALQTILLRRGSALIGAALGEAQNTLLSLYEHRRLVAQGDLPPHVKARILRHMDELITEYQRLIHGPPAGG